MKKLLLATTALAFATTAHAGTANISSTELSVSGFNTAASMQNASPTMYLSNDGRSILALKGGASAVTATIVTGATSISKPGFGTVTLSDQTVSVPASAVVLIGPFPRGRWNNSDGLVRVSMTSVVGVSATTLKVPE